jgi:class 3 adenylate cyclase
VRADAEDVMALLRDYHAAIGEIIIKYNGTLERYAGDGVMVVFRFLPPQVADLIVALSVKPVKPRRSQKSAVISRHRRYRRRPLSCFSLPDRL